MKKPVLVWVIFLLALWGSFSIASFYLGLTPPPKGATPEMIQAMHKTSLLESSLKLLQGALSLAAAIALFMLRPIALQLFIADLAVSVLQAVAGPFFSPALSQLVVTHGIWPLFAGPVLNGLFLWYAWHLKKKGTLHAQQALPADASASRPRG